MSCHGQFCHLRMLEYLLNQQVLTFYGSLILQPIDLITSVNPTLHISIIPLCVVWVCILYTMKLSFKVTFSLNLSLTLESLFDLQFE
jgi:hypothetical protein